MKNNFARREAENNRLPLLAHLSPTLELLQIIIYLHMSFHHMFSFRPEKAFPNSLIA